MSVRFALSSFIEIVIINWFNSFQFHILQTLLPIFIIPITGFFILLFAKSQLREIALITSILTFIESLRLWVYFDSLTSDFQYTFKMSWTSDYAFFFGLDGISLFFLILTCLLIPICLLASWDTIKILRKEYLLCFIALEIILIGVFTVLDLLGFYILFEAVLIPMFLIIGVWGAREQKITASYYFFLLYFNWICSYAFKYFFIFIQLQELLII